MAIAADGASEVMHRGSSFPLCVDWLPDGRLLVVDTSAARLLVQDADGSLKTHAELGQGSDPPAGNELVVDGRGNAYVNGGGFDMMAGEPYAPGGIVLAKPDGTVQQVADGLAFPNGMAVTADNRTLIVGESYAKRLTAYDIANDGTLDNRRVWADLGDGVPDGICIDTEGAVWYADVPNKHCVRVREGGDVLDTVALDRGAFACALGGPDATDPLHPRNRMERSRRHVQRRTNRTATHGPGARASSRLARELNSLDGTRARRSHAFSCTPTEGLLRRYIRLRPRDFICLPRGLRTSSSLPRPRRQTRQPMKAVSSGGRVRGSAT